MMHKSRYTWPSLLTLLACCAPAAAQAANGCYWNPERPPGPLVYSSDLGATYVAADAPVGSVIGQYNRLLTAQSPGPWLYCENNGSVTLNMYMSALLPIVPNPPLVNGEDVTGHVLQTNIPNVGVIIAVNDGFDGYGKRDFLADNPHQRVPFTAVQNQEMLVLFDLRNMRQKFTLVKLGPIAPGVHTLSGNWFSGTFQDVGYAFGSALTGTVVQSQCTLAANPVSADPVQLGEWESSDFTGVGYGTAPVEFTITLNNCVSDPNQGDPWRVATANIRLEGASGSVPLPGTDGLFSLSSDSTAAGVGIQIMRDDGTTPIPLQRDVPVTAIQPTGDTILPFTARLLQTGPVTPGLAKGSLNFTITYQ